MDWNHLGQAALIEGGALIGLMHVTEPLPAFMFLVAAVAAGIVICCEIRSALGK